MEAKTNIQFPLKLETLSPVAINSGQTLSPLADYYVEKGRLYFVDPNEFQQKIIDYGLIGAYQNKVISTKIKGADLFLNNFAKAGGFELFDITQGDSIAFESQGATIELATVVRSNGKPYIPGSSIKGAIKNCFLYYWLAETSEGKNALSNFVHENKDEFKNALNSKDRRKIKEANKKIDEFTEQITNQAFAIQNKKMTLRQVASNLLVSDTNAIEPSYDHLAVGDLCRRSFDGADWPLSLQEYLKPGALFDFTIAVNTAENDWENNKSGLWASLLYKQTDLNKLFSVINYFYNSLFELYGEMGVEVSERPNPEGGAILYLGKGKGIFKNTVLLAIKKEYDQLEYNFKDHFVSLFYPKSPNYSEFPNSYSYIPNYDPIGWVRVSYSENNMSLQNSDSLVDYLGKEVIIDKPIEGKQLSANETLQLRDFTKQEIHSGEPLEGKFLNYVKPHSLVELSVEGEKVEFKVNGYKNYAKTFPAKPLKEGKKCVIYWRDNNFTFMPK